MMVEAVGIEPTSEEPWPEVSPCAARRFKSHPPKGRQAPQPEGQPVCSRSPLPGAAATQPAKRRRTQAGRRSLGFDVAT